MTQPVSVTVARALRQLAAEMPVNVRVSSDCMTPLLESGAMIQVVRQPFYWPGDLVVVHAPDGRLLVHRLLGCYARRREWCWLTQADNAFRPDPALPWSCVIGRVVGGDCHVLPPTFLSGIDFGRLGGFSGTCCGLRGEVVKWLSATII